MSLFGSDNNRNVTTEQQKLDDRCLKEAQDLGIIGNNGALNEEFMLYDLDAILSTEPVQEGLQQKIIRVKKTKAQQLNRLVKRQVLVIADIKKDPNFAKWRKFTDLAHKYRDMLNKKYVNKAKMDVRKIISGAKSAAMGKTATDINKK